MGDTGINPEVRDKVKSLEKKFPGFKVRKLKSMEGKLDIEVS